MNRTHFRPSTSGLALIAVLGLATALPASAQLLPEGRQRDQDLFGDESAQPLLHFEETEWNFGKIPDTRTVTKVFKFRNAGSGLLTIDSVKTGCGCTVAELSIRDYLPGEEGELVITYDPLGRYGPQSKVVQIRSNDAEQPLFRIPISVEILPLVNTDSRSINLEKIVYGKGGTAEVTVWSNQEFFEIKEVTVEGTHAEVSVGEIETVENADGTKQHRAVVSITVGKDAPMGWFSRPIHVKSRVTDDTGEIVDHELNFSISANIVGDVEADPMRIPFGTPLPGTVVNGSIKLHSLTGSPFKVTDAWIEGASEGFECEISMEDSVDAKGETVTTITVTGVTPSTPGSFRGMLVVTLDSDLQPQLKIPVFGTARVKPVVSPRAGGGE